MLREGGQGLSRVASRPSPRALSSCLREVLSTQQPKHKADEQVQELGAGGAGSER